MHSKRDIFTAHLSWTFLITTKVLLSQSKMPMEHKLTQPLPVPAVQEGRKLGISEMMGQRYLIGILNDLSRAQRLL